jgi:uncharacterized protein
MHDADFDRDEDQRPREEPQPPVAIPHDALSAEALAGVIDAFVLREGTDYGLVECPHETKVRQIRRQLERGEITIVYDPNAGSVTLVTTREWAALGRSTL